jgi:sterol desaturase/sphingolipid hydroxylase (fatty acid hydroxylase superfamily)
MPVMPGDALLSHEAIIRASAFVALLAGTGLAETVRPRRPWRVSRGFRWLHNLLLLVVNTLVVRLAFPILAVGTALAAQRSGWGLLNQALLPAWLSVPLSILVLDLVIYLQHRVFHAVPVLWRLHMVHHADPDIDVTTGGRFHPFEIVLSMLIKMAAVLALGAPAVAVLLFEVLLNATSMFNHGNLALPAAADRVLRAVLVTPDMHRVHHSIRRAETNSNFGFNVPWWDHLFGTYRAQPQDGHAAMTIGLEQFQSVPRQSLGWMLALPFVGAVGDYAGRLTARP